ncbi:hypothetical protein HYALB_00004683, partial [Hymenoscyphus albidus]
MEQIQNKNAPFSCFLDENPTDTDGSHHEYLAASYRIKDTLIAPIHLERCFVEQEFDVDRLHHIMKWLWVAGRPQLTLRRELVITERMDIHMIWGQGRIFLKPIPRFLLDPKFWESSLLSDPPNYHGEKRSLRHRAMGFLVSYAALVAHESDFYIAQDRHLIPADVTWRKWQIFIRQILTSSKSVQSDVADRFIYGEIRLNRLNLVYFFIKRSLRGYISQWNSYGSFYRDNMGLVVAATTYIVVILSALQVGLGTTRLGESDAFQLVSYVFTMFSIFGPLAGVGIIVGVFCLVFVLNWVWARNNERKREKELGRSWSAT